MVRQTEGLDHPRAAGGAGEGEMGGERGGAASREADGPPFPDWLLRESEIEEIDAEGEEGAPAKSAVEVRVHVLYRGRWCGIGTHLPDDLDESIVRFLGCFLLC